MSATCQIGPGKQTPRVMAAWIRTTDNNEVTFVHRECWRSAKRNHIVLISVKQDSGSIGTMRTKSGVQATKQGREDRD